PILMTALTTILGLIPLALGIGEGTEMNEPMAIVVIGGLLSSTILTLFIVPIIYSLIEKEN
ncbi:MAG: efflux RND transporter permease subunit, partial [Solibacillus sp.]